MITAIVLINTAQGSTAEVAQTLIGFPGITEAYSVAGSYDLVAIVRVSDHESAAINRPFAAHPHERRVHEVAPRICSLVCVRVAGEADDCCSRSRLVPSLRLILRFLSRPQICPRKGV